MRPRAWLCALIAGLAACESFGAEQKIIADRVVRTVRELRKAPAEDKAAQLGLLKSLECGAKDVCDYKRECVEAYEMFVRGYEATRAAKGAIVEDASVEDGKRAAELLESAEKDVKSGSERAKKCAELEGAVVKNHGLDK